MTNLERQPMGSGSENLKQNEQLEGILSRVSAHVDAIARGHNSRLNWRDYISPFVTACYDAGIDLTDEQETEYVRGYANPGEPMPPSRRYHNQANMVPENEIDFMDKVHNIALQRLESEESRAVSPDPRKALGKKSIDEANGINERDGEDNE